MLSLKFQRFLSASIQNAMKAQVIILQKKFEGYPTHENFKIIEENLEPLKDGEFLVEAEYISVDAHQRLYPPQVGQAISGGQVAKVTESKNHQFPVGQYVIGDFGWRSRTVANTGTILTGYEGLSPSLALGALGVPGIAAYFGLLNVCKATKGNTVLVSAAAGGVGTIVGQIAKINGCKTVGITSSDEKGLRLVREVGYDAYVNYNSKTFENDLAAVTENNIDCYFDNVGGEISSIVLGKMKKFGNVAVCGSVSTYNAQGKPLASEVQTPVKIQHVVMEGFKALRWRDQWDEGIQANRNWIKDGLLKPFEYVIQGFDKTPDAFIKMLKGDNFGKTVVKVK